MAMCHRCGSNGEPCCAGGVCNPGVGACNNGQCPN
jgi:hypothetical protein